MKLLQHSYWTCFLIFAFLSYFCRASEFAGVSSSSSASSSSQSSSQTLPNGRLRTSKRSLEVSDSCSFTLLDDETLISWVSEAGLKKLKSLVQQIGFDYHDETIIRIAKLAIVHQKKSVLNVLKDRNNMVQFWRLILKLTRKSDSVFGAEYMLAKGYDFSGLALEKLVQKDAFKVVAAISSQIDNLNLLEAQLNPPSLLFSAKSSEMVRVLIDAGSSLTATDAFIQTPLEYFFNNSEFSSIVKEFPLLTRVTFLRNRLLDTVESAVNFSISVDRDRVFASAYDIITEFYYDEWFAGGMELNVSFKGETLPGSNASAIDGEGPFREFISLLIRDIFKSENALFRPLSESSFQYAPIVDEDDDTFKFAGSVVALALRESIPLGVTFIPFIQKGMLGQKVTFEDMKDHEPAYYRTITAIQNDPSHDFDANPLYFESDSDRQVNRENFDEYLIDFTVERMVNPYASQVEAFLNGFQEKIMFFPPQSLFTAAEFSVVLLGRVSLAADDFVPYFDESLAPQLREFFLRFYRECDNDAIRLKLIEFTTGCIGIPVCGLATFSPIFKITSHVHGEANIDFLARSSTCTNTLYLPPIEEYNMFRAKFTASLNAPPFFGLN